MKKKLLSLLVLMLACAGAAWADGLTWSEVKDGYTYAIINVQPENSVGKNYYLNSTDGVLTPVDATDFTIDGCPATAKFVAEKQTDGKFAFKNVDNGMYLAWKSHNGGENDKKGFVESIEQWSSWTVNASSRGTGFEGTYCLLCDKRASSTNGVGTLLIANNGSWNAANAEWTTSAYSNTYGFVELAAPETFNVTFDFKGAASGSMIVEVVKGKTPTLPVNIPSYVNYTVSPDLAAATADATYTLTTSYNSTMPFEANNGKNYNLNINRNPNLKVYTEDEAIKTVAGTEVNYANQDNFMWQFYGDWLNGFKLKNKGAGKYVTFGSKNPANKYTATLTDTPDDGAYYDLIINGGYNYFKLYGTTNNAYISNNGGAGTTFLTNWNSANNIGDAGAQFLISEAVEIDKWEAFETLLNKLQAMNIGDKLGQYSIEGYTPAITIGAISMYEMDLEAKYEDAYEDDMDGMQMMLESLSLNMPKAGSFMRIKASSAWISTPTYLSNELSTANTARAAFTQDADKIAGTETIWVWDGQYLTNYSNGLTASNNSNFMGIAQYPKTTAIAFQAAQNGTMGKYNVKFAGSRFNYTNTNLYTDAGGNPNAEGYNYELEEVTTLPVTLSTIDGHNYGTFYSPAAISDLDGVKAYIATEQDGKAVMTEIETIPANTAVVLYAKGADKTSATFTIGEASANTDGNILEGQPYNIATVTGACTLQNGSKGLGFYGYNGAALKGFKAYLNATASGVKGFVLNLDMETAIRAIQEAEQAAATYDLSGRRIEKAQKGVYIQNGKKYVK